MNTHYIWNIVQHNVEWIPSFPSIALAALGFAGFYLMYIHGRDALLRGDRMNNREWRGNSLFLAAGATTATAVGTYFLYTCVRGAAVDRVT